MRWLTVVFLFVTFCAQSQHIFTYPKIPFFDGLIESTPVEVLPTILESDTVNGWMDWDFVNNYDFGTNRGNLPMIADVRSLHPYFRDKIKELFKKCDSIGIKLALVESYRTRAKQQEYSGMGKGFTSTGPGRSKHQYGLAVDVVPIIDSVAVWDNRPLWLKIGVIGESLGLRWGGRWKSPYDPGHFEWSGPYTSNELVKGLFPPVPNPDRYPTLEAEIRLLRKYWGYWEDEQMKLVRATR